jgi:tetratricopeptide (TPR) repeat protein
LRDDVIRGNRRDAFLDIHVEDQYQRILLAAQGYCELGMFDDAIQELKLIPKSMQKEDGVIELRLAIQMQSKRWKDALKTAEELCQLRPDASAGFIHAAFCLHELGRTADARDRLLGGPPSLHKEATFHYNLACYECMLGNIDMARMHLDKAVELDKKFRDFAKKDPDLQALHQK